LTVPIAPGKRKRIRYHKFIISQTIW